MSIHQMNLYGQTLLEVSIKRLGCIGCPMAGKHREEEFEKYPKFKQLYMKAFANMLNNLDLAKTSWKTAEDVFEWWMEQY